MHIIDKCRARLSGSIGKIFKRMITPSPQPKRDDMPDTRPTETRDANSVKERIDDETVIDCWHRSFYAFGTAYALSRRATSYRRLLNFTSALGVATPAMLGAAVMSFGTTSAYIGWLISACILIGFVQFALSTISIVYAWPGALENSINSTTENNSLSEKFRSLARMASKTPPGDFHCQYREAIAIEEQQRKIDARIGLNDKEYRRGHRAALRQFQWHCKGCGTVPTNMISSSCGVCGDF